MLVAALFAAYFYKTNTSDFVPKQDMDEDASVKVLSAETPDLGMYIGSEYDVRMVDSHKVSIPSLRAYQVLDGRLMLSCFSSDDLERLRMSADQTTSLDIGGEKATLYLEECTGPYCHANYQVTLLSTETHRKDGNYPEIDVCGLVYSPYASDAQFNEDHEKMLKSIRFSKGFDEFVEDLARLYWPKASTLIKG